MRIDQKLSSANLSEPNLREEARRQSEERLRFLFESTAEFIHILDKNGRIIQVNPAIIKHSGYSESEFIGKRLDEFFTLDSRKIFVEQFKILHENGSIRQEFEFVCKDGTITTMECSISAICNKQGEILSFVSLQRDIAKKEETKQMNSEFVCQVSHELRSPLASIKGFASTILADKEMDEETRTEFLNIINDESERLARLIEDLIELSKIEHGQIKMDKQKVQILEIVQEAVSNLKPQYEKKKIALKTESPPDIPFIFCDRDMILKVLVNLLLNAFKFTPERGRVTVSVEKEREKIKVKISDTGIGIPREDLAFIFDKFYRAETPGDEKRGAGLGLSIAKEIIKSHEGDIWVESRVGKGSTFYFRLPIK